MAANPGPADRTHAGVAPRVAAAHGSSELSFGHRLAPPGDSRPGARAVRPRTGAGRSAVGARAGAYPPPRLPGERSSRDCREPALLPSWGLVDLQSDPGRARALLR